MSDIEKLFRAFAAHLTDLIIVEVDVQALDRARQSVLASLGMDAPVAKRRGRPPKVAQVVATPIALMTKKARKKMPPQLMSDLPPRPYHSISGGGHHRRHLNTNGRGNQQIELQRTIGTEKRPSVRVQGAIGPERIAP